MGFRILTLVFVFFCLVGCNDNKITYNKIEIKDENANFKIISSLDRGKAAYNIRCASCHGLDGLGIGRNFPPLANTNYIKESTEEKLYSIIINGIYGELVVNGIKYNGVMPPIHMNEEDIKCVIEYIKSLNNE